LAAVYKIQENLDVAIEQYSSAYYLQQGTMDYDAYRVEHHEVVFSNTENLKTKEDPASETL
jgi:hypothetical protein